MEYELKMHPIPEKFFQDKSIDFRKLDPVARLHIKVLKIFLNAKKKLVIVKGGDHSLSSQKWLKIIIKELKLII